MSSSPSSIVSRLCAALLYSSPPTCIQTPVLSPHPPLLAILASISQPTSCSSVSDLLPPLSCWHLFISHHLLVLLYSSICRPPGPPTSCLSPPNSRPSPASCIHMSARLSLPFPLPPFPRLTPHPFTFCCCVSSVTALK